MDSIDTDFEMQMGGRGASRPSGKGDRVAGFYLVAYLDEVPRVVAIDRFQSIIMTYDYYIPIRRVGFRHADYAIERRADGIVRYRLDVIPRMITASSSVGRNHFAARKRKGIVAFLDGRKVDNLYISLFEPFDIFYAHVVYLAVGEIRRDGFAGRGERVQRLREGITGYVARISLCVVVFVFFGEAYKTEPASIPLKINPKANKYIVREVISVSFFRTKLSQTAQFSYLKTANRRYHICTSSYSFGLPKRRYV